MILKAKTYNLKPNSRGFVALVTISIIFVVTLVVGLGLGLRSIQEAGMGLGKIQSSKAYFLANLCVEEALMKLKEDINYLGGKTIVIEGGNCQILPVEGNWIIRTFSNFQDQTKKIKVVISQVNPGMTIDSWQEVAEF